MTIQTFDVRGLLAGVFFFASIAGCGGGGGSSTPTPTPAPVAPGPTSFAVSTSAGQGGLVTPSNATVQSGDAAVFTVVPDAGYSIDIVTGCDGVLTEETYTTGAITSACEVSATFILNTYSVTASPQPGGSMSPSEAVVDHGLSTIFTISPDAGFVVNSVSGCGGSLDGSTYTTGPVTTACAVTATFSTVAELLNGKYEGVMRSPKNIFFTDSTNIIFEIDGFNAGISKEAFFGRTCLLDGALAGTAFPLTGSGTFQCSDFTEGTWTSDKIAKTNVTASLLEISMTSGSDIYDIKVAGFRDDPVGNHDLSQDYWMDVVNREDFNGIYDGNLQSLDSCAGLTFSTSPNDLSVAIDGDRIILDQDAFFEGICRFEGDIESFEEGVISAAGSYQCSNFDSGTWSTARMVMTGEDSLFTELQVDVPNRGCSYSVKYLGFKPEPITSDPIDPDPIDPDPIDPDPINPPAVATLESCNLFGCNSVALPFSQEASSSLSILPTPEWYTVGEFRLIVGPANVVISNIRAEVLSGSADAARISGLTEGGLAAGEQVQFELQSTRSQTSSTIEFAFDLDLIPGSPSSFFSRVTLTTN